MYVRYMSILDMILFILCHDIISTTNVTTIIADKHDIAVVIGTIPIGETYVVATSRPKADCSSIQLIIDPLVLYRNNCNIKLLF